jgi:hypothetical protein
VSQSFESGRSGSTLKLWFFLNAKNSVKPNNLKPLFLLGVYADESKMLQIWSLRKFQNTVTVASKNKIKSFFVWPARQQAMNSYW